MVDRKTDKIDEIFEAFRRYEDQGRQIISLFSRAYDVIDQKGRKSYTDPDNKGSSPVRSVKRRVKDLTYRIYIETDKAGELPSMTEMTSVDSNNQDERAITLEVSQTYLRPWERHVLARLRILINNEGEIKEAGSKILGREVSDIDIFGDRSKGLVLVDQVLSNVFKG